MSLYDYIRNSSVDGIVIIHQGQIVFEDYTRMFSYEKHNYMSISKTFASTLIAILEDRGQVDSKNSIETYFPELKGTAWEGILVIDILDMCSGIDCLELKDGIYSDPNSCYNQFFSALGWPSSEKAIDNILDHFASMQSHRPAGEVFEYTSINTIILSLLVERITGKTYTDFLEQEIWQQMGAESDALSLITPNGEAVSPLSISSTLRDLARYGLLFTPTGRKGSNKVISDAFLEKIQKKERPEIFASSDFPYLLNGESPGHNTYQWDFVMKDGDFFKGGAAGQGLYISPESDLVIAYFGQGNHELSHITRQLVNSGLFD